MEVLGHCINNAVATKTWKAYRLGLARVPISHLFFADDLLLFGEASVHQARVMHELLRTFCGESGQRVNAAKSPIWYAPKTRLSVISAISKMCGIASTSELGRYLGIPIIHGRTRHRHFDYLLDKVQGRLGDGNRSYCPKQLGFF